VSYTTCANANGPKALADYMWKKLLPAAAATLKKESGFDSVPYGEFVEGSEPSKGWINEAIEARYGTNCVGLRNRLSILDENYSYADFKTRVLASFAYIRAVLEFTDANAGEIAALVKRLDRETTTGYFRQPFATETKLEKLRDVTVKGWEFTTEPVTPEEKARHPWEGDLREIPSDVPRDYTVPYLALAVAKKTVPLPLGYIVLPGQQEVVGKLQAQGIVLEKLMEGCRRTAERFMIEKIEPAKTIFQGHVQLALAGHYEKAEVDVPAGSVFVDMRQPLARLVPVLLEPLSTDSLALWGFFNRVIVRQWSNEPAP
jgi:hypothetical protein